MKIEAPDTTNSPFYRKRLDDTAEEHLPQMLAESCTQLLEIIDKKPGLLEAYSISYEPVEKTLYLRLQSTAWFDIFFRDRNQIDQLRIATEFVETTKRNVAVNDMIMDKIQVIDGSECINKCRAGEKCQRKNSCSTYPFVSVQEGNNSYMLTEPEFYHPAAKDVNCNHQVTLSVGSQIPCEHFVSQQLVILNENGYVVGLKREPIRQLTMSPLEHLTNRQLVVKAKFWKNALNLCNLYGGHEVTLNFGKWETVESKNPYIMDCHGHAHINIDLENWNEKVLSRLHHNSPQKKRANQSLRSPPNYRLLDCKELEAQRLSSLQSKVFFDSYIDVAESLKGTAESLKGILESLKNVATILDSRLPNLKNANEPNIE